MLEAHSDILRFSLMPPSRIAKMQTLLLLNVWRFIKECYLHSCWDDGVKRLASKMLSVFLVLHYRNTAIEKKAKMRLEQNLLLVKFLDLRSKGDSKIK